MTLRRELMKVCCVLPLAVLAACENGSRGTESMEAPGQSRQTVLYTPPTPASGNIYDSTTYLGPVSLGRSVQTYFTQDPQYYSFKVTVPGSLVARFEVTHGGSSMYLDTGMLVYGPKNTSGSYGTSPRAQDDNYGYGDLSRIDVSLTAGEYLVVVSSGSGAGQQFRLATTCVSGACPATPPPPPDTAGYQLPLTEQALTAQLEATLEAGNDARDWTDGTLRRFDFTWPYTTSQPTLSHADSAVMALGYGAFGATDAIALSYAEARGYFYSEFDPLHAQLLATYGNGTETVQVATRYYSRLVAPGASGWFRLFVILFPESRKVFVFEQNGYET